MKEHYDRLGIPVTATLEQVKKAYKLKAKQLHPDVNKSPDAHEQFVDLQVSYDYLISVYTGQVYNHRSKKYEAPKTERTMTHEEWVRTYKEQARKRAYEQARTHFKKFKESAQYRTTTRFQENFIIGVLVVYGILCVGVPLGLLIFQSIGAGIGAFIFLNLILGQQYGPLIREYMDGAKKRKFYARVREEMIRKGEL